MSGDDIGGLKPLAPVQPVPIFASAPSMAVAVPVGPSHVDTFLDQALIVFQTVGGLGALINPGVGAAGMLATKLLQVLQAGVKAHEAAAGKPLDLSLLHHIDLIP